jgi:hypothetical protein
MAELDDVRLDQLLDRWAREQRLDAREAETVLHAILPPSPATAPAAGATPASLPATPASLPATWWSDLSAQVSAAIVLATARPATSASP